MQARLFSAGLTSAASAIDARELALTGPPGCIGGAGLQPRRGDAPKWMNKLGRIGCRNRLVQSELGWHFAARHVCGAKQQIEKRQLAGEILVARFALNAVMPVVEFG